MKWQLVLKLESKNGEKEEYVIGKEFGARLALGVLFRNRPLSYWHYLIPIRQKEILENTQDMYLAEEILRHTNIDISERTLDDLLKRFFNNESIEKAVLKYCWNNKKGLYKKFVKKCTTVYTPE